MPVRKKSPDFKIIAIKPGSDCSEHYLKVLKKNRIYYLHSEYEIDVDTDTFTFVSAVPIGLYDQGDLKINVSAIAGQNGSGKSSLIELIFMAINNIGYVNKLNDDLVPITDLHVELYCWLGGYYKIVVKDELISVFGYKNNTINPAPVDKFDLNNFFYTIAINYSLYAYNYEEIRAGQDDWLTGLFLKNDSYQTPIVVNPKRERGNIDVNTENYLVRLRLIANLLRPSNKAGFNFCQITDKLLAVQLKLTVNKEKSRHVLYETFESNQKKKVKKRLSDLTNIDKDAVLKKINKHSPFKYKKPVTERDIEATDYLVGKLVSIAVTYKEYREKNYYSIQNENFDMDKIDTYIVELLEDTSHIAFKVKQTLNFLKFPYLSFESQNIELSTLSREINEIIKKVRGVKPSIEELVPPPIFNVDILLQTIPSVDANTISQNKSVEFKMLSSGEKQMVYSISSILYHLINLESVTKRKKKIKYKFVNIILEEIELYFHPEMQRSFLKSLLDSIAILKLQSIKALNLCFVTHSPFILSDIPNSNVLFLEVVNGKSQMANRDEKTFGANIHDLLADGFFMYNGFSGAFATGKITETIDYLEHHIKLNDRNKKNISKQERTDVSIESITQPDIYSDHRKGEHLKLIQSIGESVLSNKLLEMYDVAFKSTRKDILLSEIARLTEQLNKI